MRKLRSGTLLLLAIECISSTGLIQAQGFRGAIMGTVLDQTSAPIAGADVTVKNAGTDLSRTAKTDDAGNFSVPELPLGAYFAVTTAVPLVDTTQDSLGATIQSSTIAALPVNGRDFTKMLYLTPGVSDSPDQESDRPVPMER